MQRSRVLSAVAVGFIAALANGSATAAQLKLGLVLATTGTYAFVGVAATNGALLAVEHLNGDKFFAQDTLELLTADNASNATQALTLIKRMALRDKVLLVIGPVSTAEAMAVGPVADEVKIPIFTTGTSPAITAIGPWVFRAGQAPAPLYTPLANFAADVLKVQRCFGISMLNNESYVHQKNEVMKVVKSKGVTVVGDEQILAADTDFAALSTKVVFAKPDCIYLATPPEQGANLVMQLKQAGLDPAAKILGNTGMSTANYIRIGGQAVDGTYFPAQYVASSKDPMTVRFVADYTKRFGSVPEDWAAVGYSMMMVAAHAVKAAGPDPTPEKVRDAMAKSKDIPVVIGEGKFSLDSNREPTIGAAVMMIKDGKFVVP